MAVTTIYADASFCPQTKACGYGVWIKSDRGTLSWGGVIHAGVETAGDAEWCALANAVAIAHVKQLVLPGGILRLVSDCQEVVQGFKGKTWRLTSGIARDAWLKIYEYAGFNDCVVKVAHVKAHTGADDPRSLVNRKCDNLAKRAMRARRKELEALGTDFKTLNKIAAQSGVRAERAVRPFPWEE